MSDKEKIKTLHWLVALLIVALIGSGVYIVDNELNEDNNIVNTQEKSSEKETTEEMECEKKDSEEKQEKIICDDCVTSVVQPSWLSERKSGEYKVNINNKIRTMKISLNNGEKVYIDDKLIFEIKVFEDGSVEESLDQVHIIDNEVIMITKSGSDIRSTEYYFYDKDLNKIEVDMTLDDNYPTSMVHDVDNSEIKINNRKITLTATRRTHGPDLVVEGDERSVSMCDYEANTIKVLPTKELLNKHKGEIVTAKYENTYLGNNKFSGWKLVETIEVIDENICD